MSQLRHYQETDRGVMYSRADEYRRRAILAQQRAQRATDPTLREALGEVARDWFALAEQAEWLESHHKSRTDGAVGD